MCLLRITSKSEDTVAKVAAGIARMGIKNLYAPIWMKIKIKKNSNCNNFL